MFEKHASFGGSVGPKLKLLKPIPVEVERAGPGIRVWSPDLQEWGWGTSLGAAMDDFGRSLAGLWEILHENELGSHLQMIKGRIEGYLADAKR